MLNVIALEDRNAIPFQQPAAALISHEEIRG